VSYGQATALLESFGTVKSVGRGVHSFTFSST
jgi:hypothetical protein